MAFEKVFENKYSELDKNTQYRFAEIELGKAQSTLITLFRSSYTPRQQAQLTIYKLLVLPQEQTDSLENAFFEMMNSNYITHPPKPELVHYMIMKGHTYNKIRKLTKVSFNKIADMRFGLPQYYPVFPYWNDDMILRWNDVKHTLNLFNEELAHNKI